MICKCVECYENHMLEALGGTMTVYLSLKYRETEAACPDCGRPYCPKAIYHGNECEMS